MASKVEQKNEEAPHTNTSRTETRSGNPQLDPDSAAKRRDERPQGAGVSRPDDTDRK